MPITDEGYQGLLRHLLTQIRKHDPLGYERLSFFQDTRDRDSRQALLDCIEKYSHIVKPSSRDTYGAVLRSLNENIHGEIDGISLQLSREEHEIYQQESVDLVPPVDKSDFIGALRELYHVIAEEGGDDDSRRNQR